jgi:anti-sigma factor RsiW
MKWRCALIQKWWPAYLDGDLSSFWRQRLELHLQGCPACREELAGLQEVIRRVRAAAVPDQDPAFWQTFHRELHLKLAQSVPAPEPSRFLKIPYYLLGAPALAVLVFWAFTHLGQPPHKPVLTAMVAPEQVVYAGMEDGAWQGDDFPSWDMEAVMADLTHQERQAVLQRVRY